MRKIVNLDLTKNYYLQRPSGQCTFAGLSNVLIEIFNLENVPIGKAPTDLPDYIKNSKSINALLREKGNNKPYNDNKCFFRCLALKGGAQIHGLERETNHYSSNPLIIQEKIS